MLWRYRINLLTRSRGWSRQLWRPCHRTNHRRLCPRRRCGKFQDVLQTSKCRQRAEAMNCFLVMTNPNLTDAGLIRRFYFEIKYNVIIWSALCIGINRQFSSFNYYRNRQDTKKIIAGRHYEATGEWILIQNLVAMLMTGIRLRCSICN